MNDDSYARYIRFQTPDPLIPAREQAPMTAEEQAWAHDRGSVHRFSWISILLPPLCFGPVLPGVACMIVLAVYQALIAPELDLDQVVGDNLGWLVIATLLFTAAWTLRNFLREKHDRTKHYWQSMPARGVVELEHHILEQGISLWANDYDPESGGLTLWRNGKLEYLADSGISQWLLAKTNQGHWLVLKQNFPGSFTYDRVGRLPAADTHMQPRQELTITFAPGTQLALGQRFSGAPLPLTETEYWLTTDELKRLGEAAHHWMFFHPQRYGVVSEQDVPWLERLIDKAKASSETTA